ncbi:hypothetical protein E2C01_020497 [Portunus trituberculatus]|uniref:Uncharacterized protein n=1 Tax=Portunus trituberculatus TaxID=210409 RepID=A0A5B7E0A0_PORTR|nr:hypothetical protein [Portunus trituberculatus]
MAEGGNTYTTQEENTPMTPISSSVPSTCAQRPYGISISLALSCCISLPFISKAKNNQIKEDIEMTNACRQHVAESAYLTQFKRSDLYNDKEVVESVGYVTDLVSTVSARSCHSASRQCTPLEHFLICTRRKAAARDDTALTVAVTVEPCTSCASSCLLTQGEAETLRT